MKLTTGSFEIVESGVVRTMPNQPLGMEIESRGFRVKVIVRFRNDTDNTAGRAESVVEGNDTILITLVNFNNSLGMWNTRPFEIANSTSGEKLYLSLVVHDLAKAESKLVTYTWYVGGEGQDGGQ
jgi:hypothetical protein